MNKYFSNKKLELAINQIEKKYSNGDVTVLWEPGKCINSAK